MRARLFPNGAILTYPDTSTEGLPIVEVRPPIRADQHYGRTTYTLSPDETTVVATVAVAPIPLAERNALNLSNPAKLRAILARNRSYLAIPSPTAAETAAQTQALTRQVNALIRLLHHMTNEVSDSY